MLKRIRYTTSRNVSLFLMAWAVYQATRTIMAWLQLHGVVPMYLEMSQ